MKINTFISTRKSAFVFAAAIAAVAVTGCYNPDGTQNNTATGALAGGAFGAASGAAIGSASHSAGEGALIGAGAGTLLGALIGNSADQQQQARIRQQQAAAAAQRAQQPTPLSLNDVKALAKSGLSDDTIIAQITVSHTVYHVSATDIIDLHANGVSQRVIDFIVNTPTTITPPTTDVAVATAPPPAPVDPIPVSPDPGYVWVGGEWVWGGGGWYWRSGYWGAPLYPGYIWYGGYWGHGRYYPGHWGRR